MTSNIVEYIATILLLILAIIALSHLLNGTFITWASSKIKAAPA